MAQRLSGRTALVTGAGGTLGSAIVRGFVDEGASAVVVTDLSTEVLREVCEEHRSEGVELLPVELDVTDGDRFDSVVTDVVHRWGRLDVLVNNAGVVPPNARIQNLSTDDWTRTVSVNLTGTFHGVRAAARFMRERGGSVVNVASVSAVTAWPYAAPYCAAKAGVVHLTRVAALEYAADRLRVNCVCPGAFHSSIHRDMPAQAMDAIEDRHPLGLGKAEDVVGAVMHLASDESTWTTGQAFVVDGGYSLP